MLIGKLFLEKNRFWIITDGDIIMPANLRLCLKNEAKIIGISEKEIDIILDALNNDFLEIECFLNDFGINCYKLDKPHDLTKTKKQLSGSNTYPFVATLMKVLYCAYRKLFNIKSGRGKFDKYMQKLSNPKSFTQHMNTLVEMLPLLRTDDQIEVDFEVIGYSPGNKDIDWLIKLPTRSVLIDVKRRIGDLYSLMDRPDTTKAPQHDPSLLFRSVEDKFNAVHPDIQLQGVWIITQVKQPIKELHDEFNKLDKDRVHFAILGDEQEDAYIIARRDEDKSQLMELFKLVPSKRFLFNNPEC